MTLATGVLVVSDVVLGTSNLIESSHNHLKVKAAFVSAESPVKSSVSKGATLLCRILDLSKKVYQWFVVLKLSSNINFLSTENTLSRK